MSVSYFVENMSLIELAFGTIFFVGYMKMFLDETKRRIGNRNFLLLDSLSCYLRYLQQRISKIKADGNDQELRYMFHQMLPDATRY